MATSYDSYELGFAAETGWKAITEGREEFPPFDYVQDLLHERLDLICRAVSTISPVTQRYIYITSGETFRYNIAKTKPYKGTRIEKKPYHYNNLTVYLKDVLGAEVITGIEADDKMAVGQTASNATTCICTRDKDLRQVPGWFYSWELGRQPEFGPVEISHAGTLSLSKNKKKINATGMALFYSQLLTGDRVDNIPGIEGIGPVAAYDALKNCSTTEDMLEVVKERYQEVIGKKWEEYLLEMGQLLWMVRRMNGDGSPQIWKIGQEH